MTLDWWIELIVKTLVVFAVFLTGIAYSVLVERRVLAHIQARIGPNRVGYQGLLQPIADALKLISKEFVIPKAANKIVFVLAPVLSMTPALLTVSVIPFGDSVNVFGREVQLRLTDINVAVLFILALSSISVYGAFLGGWSSNNKYSIMGSVRASAQMISYELILGLAVVSVVLLSGSFSLVEIVNAQRPIPFIVYQPLGFVLFFVGTMAEINRVPFDLPEAEPELVSGYHTEYSGMWFALYFLGEYAHLITVTSMTTLLFLGGWLVPWPSPAWMAPVWFLMKVGALILFMMWTRGTLPRLRFDQLMRFGWKVALPAALFNVFITALYLALTQ